MGDMRMMSGWVVASLCGVVAGTCRGQTGEEVMWEMARAFEEAASIRARATFHGTGPLMLRTPRGEALLELAHTEEGRRVALRGELWRFPSGEGSPIEVVLDGASLHAADAGERVYASGPVSRRGEILPDELDRVFNWLWSWETFVEGPFGGGGSGYDAELLGATVLEGERCDVVRVDYSEIAHVDELDVYWFIAEGDRLPRRIEATYFFGDGSGVGVLSLHELAVNAAVEDETFEFEPPEGFTEREVAEEQARGVGGAGVRPVGIPVGEVAPDWTLTDPAGREHTLSDYRGKVVLLDFWATWCGPCKLAMPGLEELHQELKAKGLEVFGLNCWDQPGAAERYMEEEELTYTTLLNADPVAQTYKVSGIPTFYLVGPDGRVLMHEVGFNPAGKDALREVILEHLPE